jgi:hypothetical protein
MYDIWWMYVIYDIMMSVGMILWWGYVSDIGRMYVRYMMSVCMMSVHGECTYVIYVCMGYMVSIYIIYDKSVYDVLWVHVCDIWWMYVCATCMISDECVYVM